MMPFDDVAAFVRSRSDFVFGANRRICEELIPGLRPEYHDVLYPAIDVPTTLPPHQSKRLLSGQIDFQICEFATLNRNKRLEIGILAIAELRGRGRHVELVIVGDEEVSYTAELRRLVERLRLGDRVHIREFTDDVFGVMVESDAVVISALVHSFGRTALEGMLHRNAGGVSPRHWIRRLHGGRSDFGSATSPAIQCRWLIGLMT